MAEKKKSNLPPGLAAKARAAQVVPKLEKPFAVKVIEKSTGKIVELRPRAMNRGELRALRQEGLDPIFWEEKRALVTLQVENPDDPQEITQALMQKMETVDSIGRRSVQMSDWILDNVYAGYDFDAVSNPECRQLTQLTYQLTMGTGDEIKNS